LQSGWAGATSGSPGAAPTSWGLGFGTGTVTTVVSSTAGPIASAVRFDYDNTERVYFDQSITVTSGTQYAFSIYVEALSGAVAGDVLFVLAGTTSATINTYVTNPSATGRYTFLFTANGNGTVTLRAGAGTSAALSGTGSITLSRPQCEAGAFATSVIPTTTTALTRSADVASVNTLSPWFNATEGTIYAEAVCVVPTSVSFVAQFNDLTASNFIDGARYQTTLRSLINTGGVNQSTLTPGTAAGAVNKTALGYAANDIAMSANGAAALTDTSATIPTVTRLWLGDDGSGSPRYLNGYLRRITYYPRRLSDAELQAITA